MTKNEKKIKDVITKAKSNQSYLKTWSIDMLIKMKGLKLFEFADFMSSDIIQTFILNSKVEDLLNIK